MIDFNGRTVLVTGASGGIGGATARHLVSAGADVIASGRSQETLAARATQAGAHVLSFEAPDVATGGLRATL
jgi:NADP-dependent 3-hydroxy acid dehydrogenase YdfG